MWERLDSLIHWLHLPFTGWICDRYDIRIWQMFPDEPVEDVVAAFDRAEHSITEAPVGWTCEHLTITAAGGLLSGPPLLSFGDTSHGCAMRPVYANRAVCRTGETWRA